jgi:hypothetical protein
LRGCRIPKATPSDCGKQRNRLARCSYFLHLTEGGQRK